MNESKKITITENETGTYFDGWRGIYIPANVILMACDHGFHDDGVDSIVEKHYPDEITSYDNDDVEREIADLEYYLEIFEDAERYLESITELPDGYFMGYNEYDGSWGVWKCEEDDD